MCWAAFVPITCSAWAHPSTSPTRLAERKPASLGQAPGWPRNGPDILTAQHLKVEAEDSSDFLPGPCGRSGFRPGPLWSFSFLVCLAGFQRRLCSGSTVVHSGRDGTGPIFPPASVLCGAQGRWGEVLLAVRMSGWGAARRAAPELWAPC